MHPTLADALMQWRKHCTYIRPEELGFCKQALSGPKTVLGTGDLAQIYTTGGTTSRNSEAIRMAYVPAHLLDTAAKRGD
jgi:hypothetical protein